MFDPPVGLKNQGGTEKKPVYTIDCEGGGISCSQSGITATLTTTGTVYSLSQGTGIVFNPVSTITASGTISLATPVQTGNGGTGVSTLALNGILYGNGTSALQVTAQGPANSILTANAGAPSFSASPTIGTSVTSPLLIGGTGTTSTLSVRSTSGVGATGSDLIFQTGNNGATEAMRILNSGSVGIGTASPGLLLHLSSASNVQGIRIERTGSATGAWDVRTQNNVGADADFNITDAANGRNILTITKAAGNVGIGTTGPGAKLHNTGSTLFGSATLTANSQNDVVLFGANLTGNAQAGAFYNKLIIYGGGGESRNLQLYQIPSGAVRIDSTIANLQLDTSANNSNIVLNTGTGNVGIGTTTPSKKLAVSGDIRIQSSGETITGPTSVTSDASNPGLYLSYDATNNKALIRSVFWGTAFEPLYFQGNEFRWATGAGSVTEKMVLDVSGNVGIGTTGPLALLHLENSAGAVLRLTRAGFSPRSQLSVDGTNLSIGQLDSGDIVFNTGAGAETVRFRSGGNVGIGTTSPQAVLDLVGSDRMSTTSTSVNLTLSTTTHNTILATTGAGGITVTLPAASANTIGLVYYCVKVDAGAGVLTIAAAGADTVNGVASKTIATQYSAARVIGISATAWVADNLGAL